jgi:phospholipase/carboxylesterase
MGIEWCARPATAPRGEAGPPPLLVLLHGVAADETDLFPLAEHVDPRFTVVSLRAPHPYYVGFAWFRLEFLRDGSVLLDGDQARASLAALVGWLEAASTRFGTDPARTFLLGFSQGAIMSLALLSTVPERLAGVVALSGRRPHELFARTAPPAAIAAVPLLVVHGLFDDILPVAHGRAIRDAFTGLTQDLTYREFPVGHGIDPDAVPVIGGWLAARLDAPSPLSAARAPRA